MIDTMQTDKKKCPKHTDNMRRYRAYYDALKRRQDRIKRDKIRDRDSLCVHEIDRDGFLRDWNQMVSDLNRQYKIDKNNLNVSRYDHRITASGKTLDYKTKKRSLWVHLELLKSMDADTGKPVLPSGDDLNDLKKYAHVQGKTISRDIIIPASMPLYALHFTIQRLFGFECSHMYDFRFTDRRLMELCAGNKEVWKKTIGVIFRDPYYRRCDLYSKIDYDKSSYREWLRKKYTYPYPHIHNSRLNTIKPDDQKIIDDCRSLDDLFCFFKADPFVINESLLLSNVLCVKYIPIPLSRGVLLHTHSLFPVIDDFSYHGLANELIYVYDYTAKWRIRITASPLTKDLNVPQEIIDEANLLCSETNRPVLVAHDGDMLLDGVGGFEGYIEFLKTIDPDLTLIDPNKIAYARQKRDRKLKWASDRMWKRSINKDLTWL